MTTACLNLPYLFNTLTPDKNIYLKKHIAGRYIIYLSTFIKTNKKKNTRNSYLHHPLFLKL